MKIKNMKKSVARYKKQFLLTSKINNTLSSFNKKIILSKNISDRSLYPNQRKKIFYNKSFSQTTTSLNKNQRNLSFNNINNFNHTYIIETENKTTNFLSSLYKNSFYPKPLKNKNFIRELYNQLPFLHLKKDKEENDNNKVKEILINDYKNSVSNFNEIYKTSGEELINEIKTKEFSNESVVDFVKNNRINNQENNYISSIIKSRKKNISVEFENENYRSPKNSLLTLKINNQLINNIKESVVNYQYNSYVEKINETQKNKLKLLIMPKLNIKLTKFHFDTSQKTDKDKSKDKETNLRRQSYYKKYNSYLLGNSKNKKDKKENDKEKATESNNMEDNNPEQITVIDSVNMRNSLILEVKSYYCKYLKRTVDTPSSRIEATFTKFKSKLYLFEGSASDEVNE
jgi:hypothetical protein